MTEAADLIKQIKSLKGIVGVTEYRRELINQLAEIYYQRGKTKTMAKTLAALLDYNRGNIQDYLDDKYKYQRYLPSKGRSRPTLYSEDELEWIKEKNFTNKLHYYKEELLAIAEGKTPKEVGLTANEIRSLSLHGILSERHSGAPYWGAPKHILDMLENLEE